MARPISAHRLLALLDEARSRCAGPIAVAADGDGTLWRGDIGEALFEKALSRGLLRPEAGAALAEEARRHEITCHDSDSNAIGAALLSAHRAGRYPNADAFAMMAWAFAGWSQSDLSEFCRALLTECDFEDDIRDEMRPVMSWAARHEIPLWLVSASPWAVVIEAAERLELPASRVLAMQPACSGGVLLSRLAATPTYGAGKLARMRQQTTVPILAAFGDSDYDFELLDEAQIPVAVFPSAQLRQRIEPLERAYILGGQ